MNSPVDTENLQDSASISALEPVWRASLCAHGFSWRKRALVRDFTGRRDVRFVDHGAEVPEGADLLLWGSSPVPAGAAGSSRIFRLEDGFLRSVGLGADLTRPISWVIDATGIYFDPRVPSDLETILQMGDVGQPLLTRARALRALLVTHGLSKYNLTGPTWQRPRHAQHVVLVAGQVETDASIACGAPGIRTNVGLLQTVRRERPDAWLVYKPHPDVVAGLRERGSRDGQALKWANEVVTSGSPGQLLAAVDEVHVMTSLLGFEALLRGVPVHCHGLPFYAGWGLTHDRQAHPRRTRRIDLDELVAAALLIYPRYVSLRTRQPCTPEQALAELLARRDLHMGHAPWWRRLIRPFLAKP